MSALPAWILAQQSSSGGGAAALLILLIELGLVVVIIAGLWKVFEKAGEPGWAAIVPIYNAVVLLKIAEKPLWWIILYFIPIINLIPAILVPVAVAKNFGKGVGFAIGLFFLPFIFYPILGFSDAQYQSQGTEQRGFPVGPAAR